MRSKRFKLVGASACCLCGCICIGTASPTSWQVYVQLAGLAISLHACVALAKPGHIGGYKVGTCSPAMTTALLMQLSKGKHVLTCHSPFAKPIWHRHLHNKQTSIQQKSDANI